MCRLRCSDTAAEEVTETLLFYKLGELSCGPELLGSFDGRRVEEITGSTMTLKDFVTNANVARALAKVMARHHLINVPMAGKPSDVVNISNTCYLKFRDAHLEFADCYLDKGKDIGKYERLRGIIEFDVNEFTDWISKVSKMLDTRIESTHNDANRSDIIIKGPAPNLDSDGLDQRLIASFLDIRIVVKISEMHFICGSFISPMKISYRDTNMRMKTIGAYL